MDYGPRVASIEAALGADMTPGRHARWERLDLDPADPTDPAGPAEPDENSPDPEPDAGSADVDISHRDRDADAHRDPRAEVDDVRLDAGLDDSLDGVVPHDASDREAFTASGVDAARERFVSEDEVTRPPEQAVDLAAHPENQQQPDPHPAHRTTTPEPAMETTETENDIRHKGINFPGEHSPDWDAWRRDVATAQAQGYPEWDAHAYAEAQRDARQPETAPEPFEPYLTTLRDGSLYLVEEHLVPAEHRREHRGPEAEADQPTPEQGATRPEHDEVERDQDAAYDQAYERDRAAEQGRVAALTAAMSTDQARSIVSDPTWHDERYAGDGDHAEFDAAQAVCERDGIEHRTVTDTIERYLDGHELDAADSDAMYDAIRAASQQPTHDDHQQPAPVEHEQVEQAEPEL